MNFYKHHLGDYDGHTAHLSWDEDMAYTRLLRAYYRREAPIAVAEAYRLTRAFSKGQRGAVDRVLAEFFTEIGGYWHNKRADEEIEEYQGQCQKNREVGKLGGRPKKTDKVIQDNPQETQEVSRNNPNQIPEPDTRTRRNKGADAPDPDWLPPEWAEYLQHRTEKKSKFTPTARRGCITKLDGWRQDGHDISAVLRHAIDNGYTGLFLPHSLKNKQASLETKNRNATANWTPPEERNAT